MDEHRFFVVVRRFDGDLADLLSVRMAPYVPESNARRRRSADSMLRRQDTVTARAGQYF
jgi:hypothetical protein